MIKLFRKRFLHKSAKKFLEERLEKLDFHGESTGVEKVAVLVNLDQIKTLNGLENIRKELNLRSNGWHLIGYSKSASTVTNVMVCNPKELGWNGSIESGNFKEFESRSYDLLLNVFEEADQFLQIMSARIDARRRVGFLSSPNKLNHLMINCKISELDIFRNELLKYLKILGEI